jgi:hypothetical protein
MAGSRLNETRCPASLANIDQSPLHNGPRAIAEVKKKDLLTLLHLIPPCFHVFYKTIPVARGSDKDIDVDGFPSVLDFDLELEDNISGEY